MIKPQRLTYLEIRERADNFRKQYASPEDVIPLEIEEIIEFNLKLDILPIDGLKQTADIDAFLSNDLSKIYVDNGIYNDDRYTNRLRFTYAHEIGHLVLHKEEIENCEFQNADEWVKLRLEMPEEDLSWFEFQAHEFAGRLLVPRNILLEKVEDHAEKIEQFLELSENGIDDLLFDTISRIICDDFGVSSEVIKRRLVKEKIFEELGFL
jgi:Zn-dependent peptidase ImmA (M78 family)